jgi:hypothetical protein
MSYTRPPASAADATWQGAVTYVRPDAGSADAAWAGEGAVGFATTVFGLALSGRAQAASGFTSGYFGVPLAPYASTGFQAAAFGTPFGVFKQIGLAAGFRATSLGSASTPLPVSGFIGTRFGATTAAFWQISDASGLLATHPGDPFGQQHWSAEPVGLVTRFSKAFYAFAQTQAATGRRDTTFGQPMAFRILAPNTAQLTRAFGFAPTAVGAPTAGWLQTAGVAGFVASRIGAPSSAIAQRASGIAGAVFGSSTESTGAHPAGFAVTVIGSASMRLTQPAAGINQPARFGLASSARSDTFAAYGINRSGRVGHPTGFSRFNYPAVGFRGMYIGTPVCREVHRAPHMPPGTIFGKPLLRRTPLC